MSNEPQEPLGISFFNVKSGETHYAKLEPTIAAYINMSDLGINASRGQDFGWKLGADWVKRVRSFRRDPMQMSLLASRNQGAKPTTVQILYYLYGQELAAFAEEQDENEAPFAEDYQRQIGEGSPNAPTAVQPAALSDFQDDDGEDDLTDLIDDAVAESDEEAAPEQPPVTEEKPKADKPVAKSKQTQKAQ
jgi:hypothetical protein